MDTHTPQRTAVLSEVAAIVAALHPNSVVRVGVDGVDGAGKTVFADELAEAIVLLKRPTIRASVDGFHHPRSVRHRRGRGSSEGFFYDSYNYALLSEALLDPLSPRGDRRYRTAAFDYQTNRAVDAAWEHAPDDAVLIVDGIFLHRLELRQYWDFSVFLQVGFDVSIPRGAQRGYGDPDPSAQSNRRYVEGQLLYFEQCRPTDHASVLIDNDNLDAPRIIRTATHARPD
jgi:uridine kinase